MDTDTPCCESPLPRYWCSGCHKTSCPHCMMTCCYITPSHVVPVALLDKYQCPAERQFGQFTHRCQHRTGHASTHQAQRFTWGDDWWAEHDENGETVAAVSTADRIDLATVKPYTGPITDDQYRELFLRGEFFIVREES